MSLRRRTRCRRAITVLSAIAVAAAVLCATPPYAPDATGLVAPAAAAVRKPNASHTPKIRRAGAISRQLLAKINAERRNRGLRKLRRNGLLEKYAEHWGRHLIRRRDLRHQDLGRIIAASRYRLAGVGENLFRGSGRGAIDAGTAHISLMRSPSHRANILLPQAQVAGIAALCMGHKLMVVQEFAIKAGAPLPERGQGVMPLRPLVAKSLGGRHC
jgi:uncharacterized protein YkwD